MSEEPLPDPNQLVQSQTPSMPVDANGIIPASQEAVDQLQSGPAVFPDDPTLDAVQKQSYLAARRLWENKELDYKSTHDELTGDLNLRGLQEKLGNDHQKRSVVFLDVTNFKEVNDTLGHGRGDQVLIEMSKIIHESFRPEDLIARLGGDEFFVVLNESIRPEHSSEHGAHEDTTDTSLEAGKKRLHHGVLRFLSENYDLQALHLALASGGTIWQSDESFEAVKARADAMMMQEKAEQHEEFQYRKSATQSLNGYRPKHALENHQPARVDESHIQPGKEA